MKNTSFVLGADGGGTKTLGYIADATGTILGRQQVGAANPNVVGLDAAARHLAELVVLCCREAGCTPADLGALVFGLAGAGNETLRTRLIDAVNHAVIMAGGPALPIVIETDARIAVEGAFGGNPGIVVIAGTGSVVIGKNVGGEILQIGGWGRVLGDEGSGYQIGLEALKAITRDFDRRGDAALLRRRVAETHGLDGRERIIAAVYREKFSIPSLAPLVLQCADEGDALSSSILERAALQLAEQVEATARAIHIPGTVGVVFCGGLIDHATIYAGMLRTAILALCPRAEVRPAVHPSVHGAVLMALHRIQ
jgi:N-acetylglucosamine kinase-like BadF-type ATPase